MARKIVGGLAWPHQNKPGYAVVVAVDYDTQDPEKKPAFKVLDEASNLDVARLILECLRLQAQYETGDFEMWFGDAMNQPMASIWTKVSSGKRFLFSPPPYFGESNATDLYWQAILTNINNDNLLFREGSRLPGDLNSILPETDIKNIAEYPPLAALGYVMGALYENWLQLPYEKKPKTGPQRIIERVESTDSEWDSGLLGYGKDEDEEGFFPE